MRLHRLADLGFLPYVPTRSTRTVAPDVPEMLALDYVLQLKLHEHSGGVPIPKLLLASLVGLAYLNALPLFHSVSLRKKALSGIVEWLLGLVQTRSVVLLVLARHWESTHYWVVLEVNL